MTGLTKRNKKKRWLLGYKIESINNIFRYKWIAILHDNGEYTVLPSWWARWFTKRRFMKYITKGNLYEAIKNLYLH